MVVSTRTWIALGLVIIITVAGGIAYWWYTRPVTPPTPGEFEFSNLVIEPTEVFEGDTVTISVNVTNVGEEEKTGSINLLLNGAVAATKATTVAAGETVTVTFTITKLPGDYTVAIDALSGTLTVLPIFKVAWIMEGVALDGSWEEWQYKSALKIDAEIEGVEFSFSERVAVADFVRVAGDFAAAGYDLIYATTTDYQYEVLTVAAQYPNTYFAVTGGWEYTPNVAGIDVWTHETLYLAGMLAALTTQTNHIGIVGGFQYPSQVTAHNGYRAGYRAVNPDIVLHEVWTGTWYDVTLGYEAAKAMIDDYGVDFVAITLSGPGIGAIDAADEAGVYSIGAFLDMTHLAPDSIVANVIWSLYDGVVTLIEKIREGTFEGKEYMYALANGGTDLTWGTGTAGQAVPQSIKDQIEAAKQDIIDGILIVPFVPDRLMD